MKMLKNKLRIILLIVITAILVSGISVYATYNYLASNVKYTKKDGTEISVEDALNELYTNQKKFINIGQGRLDTSYGSNSTACSYNLKNIEDYKNIILDDIYVVINKLAPAGGSGQSDLDYQEIQKNYNNETGVLTITAPKVYYKGAGVWLDFNIYVYH